MFEELVELIAIIFRATYETICRSDKIARSLRQPGEPKSGGFYKIIRRIMELLFAIFLAYILMFVFDHFIFLAFGYRMYDNIPLCIVLFIPMLLLMIYSSRKILKFIRDID